MSTYPLFIDNLAFARKNERLEGVLSLSDCPRLSSFLYADITDNVTAVKADADIHYLLQGTIDGVGQHYLKLTIAANLTATCQRCLHDMPIKLTLGYNYLIVDSSVNESEVNEIDSDDDVDLQEASQMMDLVALIEDEIIMAMPIAPTHDEDCSAGSMQSGDKSNPFAVLKGLIKP
jgi:uncharacterized protein